ncbi:hypothetical protein BMI86_00415 [Thioclava sp. DLFJ5-1]|uniref:hypothetical protein n=1 Tax=Thioclava sp. DLFJ5-1 TaxID=1915314 RepID=UPI0009CAABDE|nr:hypothetical protein [Thioclava sp. DLFJ5-1]OOY21087.1 hypothetical protein BMI86_00415 [Thioclava sp. DLFJ5-1]
MSYLLLLPSALLIAVGTNLLLRPATRAGARLRGPELATVLGLLATMIAAVTLARSGPETSPLLGVAGIGLSARSDIVSISLALTVGFVGWAVLRFSRVALDGGALAISGLWHEPPQAIALGAILVFGVAYLIAQGLAEAAPWPLFWRTTLMSLGATLGYFALHWGANALSAGALPPPPVADPLVWLVMLLTVVGFGLAAWAQATFPLWGSHPAAAGLRVHLMNGLYLNALTDRLIGQTPLKKG